MKLCARHDMYEDNPSGIRWIYSRDEEDDGRTLAIGLFIVGRLFSVTFEFARAR